MIRLYTTCITAILALLATFTASAEFSATVDPTAACVGDDITVTITGTEPNAIAYGADYGDGQSEQINGSATHQYAQAGTYYVIVAAIGFNAQFQPDTLASETFVVTISGANDSFDMSASNACPDTPIDFEYLGTFNNLLWDFGDGTTAAVPGITHSFSTLGEKTVALTIETDCDTTTLEQIVTIENSNVFSGEVYMGIDGTLCPGSDISFYAAGAEVDQYIWAFSNGNTATGKNIDNQTFDAGNYTVSVTTYDACGNDSILSQDFSIEIPTNFSGSPVLLINDSVLCSGAQLYVEVYGLEGTEMYTWDRNGSIGLPTSIDNITALMETVGAYTVNVSITDACEADTALTTTINVSSDPGRFTGFTMLMESDDNVCPGHEIEYELLDNFAGFAWDFDDGTIIAQGNQKVTHVFDTAGTYNVSVTVTDFCGADTLLTEQTTIISSTEFVGNDGVSAPTEVCPNAQFTITAGIDNASYSWNLGDGTLLSSGPINSVDHAYAELGTYTVSVVITDFCGNQVISTTDIKVGSNVGIADFVAQVGPDTICPGDAVTGSASASPGSSFVWELGDGETLSGSQGMYIYNVLGDYTITVTATNTCGNTGVKYFDINVGNSVQPDPNHYSSEVLSGEVCPGDSVLFVANPTGAATYTFDFDNGTTGATVTLDIEGHTNDVAYAVYNDLGQYYATMTATNGCGNSVEIPVDGSVSVTANQPVDGGFDTENQQGLCVDLPVEFTAYGGGSYVWDFGDGSTAETAGLITELSHSYASAGNYTVQVEITNSCLNTKTYSQTIYVDGCVVVGQDLMSRGSDLTLFPNPTNGTVQLSWLGKEGQINVAVTDLQGRSIFAKQYAATSTGWTTSLNLGDVAPGMYYVNVITQETNSINTLIVK